MNRSASTALALFLLALPLAADDKPSQAERKADIRMAEFKASSEAYIGLFRDLKALALELPCDNVEITGGGSFKSSKSRRFGGSVKVPSLATSVASSGAAGAQYGSLKTKGAYIGFRISPKDDCEPPLPPVECVRGGEGRGGSG